MAFLSIMPEIDSIQAENPEDLCDQWRMKRTKLPRGFARAVQPVEAHYTSDRSLIAEEVKIPAHDGEIPAYLARPREGESFPVVLVIQEIVAWKFR